MKQDENTNVYLTSDLALASAINMHIPMESIDRTNPRKAIFVFKRSVDLEKIVDLFFRNEMRVTPLSYFNQLREIKARLYSEVNY